SLSGNFGILTAQTGIEAMMLLESNDVDVVISDYRLANTNGAELLNIVAHRWPHVTRIIITGYNSAQIARDAVNRAGVFKFITKPWNDDDLKLILEAAVKRSLIVRTNTELLSEIRDKNTKIEEATKVIERGIKLKEKKLIKSKESMLGYQVQINAINELLAKISSGRNFKDLVGSILEGLRNVVNCDYSTILSIAEQSSEFNLYSEGRSDLLLLDDYPDFKNILDTMERNNHIPLILSSIYATESSRELFFNNTDVYSILLYPLRIKASAGKSYVYILVLGREGKNIFDKRDVSRLREISGSIYVALERLITTNFIQRGLKQWEETFNAIMDPLFILSLDYKIVRVNNAIEKLTGEKASQMIGRRCYEVFKKRDAVCDNCLVARVLASRQPESVENVPCFEEKNIIASAFPIFDKDENLSSVIQYNNDRSAEFKLYKQLIQSEKLAAIGLLAANIAHEINNPLGGILAYAQILKREISDDASFVSDLEEIESACQRCKSIISNLLDFSRDTSGESKRKIQLTRLIDSTLPLLNVCLKGHNLVIDVKDHNLWVYGNLGQLQQVLFNLITNAAHATPKGGEIRVKVYRDQLDNVIIEVSDKGSGIPENVLPMVFEPFFTTKEKGSGTGLGLFVSHGIITEHGGFIDLRSKVGEGTNFIISLPQGI
ncbi:MAG: response regulator, partial [Oligoflexia bacterium]|nr:response regulator [Oligoflexia bacterium]